MRPTSVLISLIILIVKISSIKDTVGGDKSALTRSRSSGDCKLFRFSCTLKFCVGVRDLFILSLFGGEADLTCLPELVAEAPDGTGSQYVESVSAKAIR